MGIVRALVRSDWTKAQLAEELESEARKRRPGVFLGKKQLSEIAVGVRLIRLVASLSDDVSEQSYIYFIQHNDIAGPVKIGLASDPAARLAALQTGNPFPLFLRAYAAGGRHAEGNVHRCLRSLNIRGEWFRCASTLKSFLAAVERVA